MFNLETTLENGWPALLVMVAAIGILAFLRLVVPYLIVKWQRKRPISRDR